MNSTKKCEGRSGARINVESLEKAPGPSGRSVWAVRRVAVVSVPSPEESVPETQGAEPFARLLRCLQRFQVGFGLRSFWEGRTRESLCQVFGRGCRLALGRQGFREPVAGRSRIGT